MLTEDLQEFERMVIAETKLDIIKGLLESCSDEQLRDEIRIVLNAGRKS